jgi:hypothetical protein
MSKFKVGDRVRVTKSGTHDFKVGDVGTIYLDDGPTKKSQRWRITVPGKNVECNWMYDREMELVTNQGGAPVARKTYKLIKDTPTVKKGAIYQEACDDGTQEYIILDKAFIKDTSGNGQVPIYTRSLVEDAPQWFVEVFQVEPQYMTAVELEQWEAFKAKAKKPAAKTIALEVTKKPGRRTWTPAQRKSHSAKIKAAWAAKKVNA